MNNGQRQQITHYSKTEQITLMTFSQFLMVMHTAQMCICAYKHQFCVTSTVLDTALLYSVPNLT